MLIVSLFFLELGLKEGYDFFPVFSASVVEGCVLSAVFVVDARSLVHEVPNDFQVTLGSSDAKGRATVIVK